MVTHTLNMPRLGETMDEGRIANWCVAEGASFRRGEPIVEIETDKTVVEYPALGDGRLTEHLAREGDNLSVGDPLARIEIGDTADWPDIEQTGEQEKTEPQSPAEASLVDLAMPRLGETMEEGRIVRWLKAAGAVFERGEALLEVETDKTVAEYPALQPGRLAEILRGEDETVSVGEPIARIEVEDGQAPSRPNDKTTGGARPETGPHENVAPPRSGQSHAPTPHAGRCRATPVARRMARRSGLDIASIAGTGRRGRIEKHDVLAALEGEAIASVAMDSGADMAFADIAGGRMAYRVQGPEAGVPVLLIHGFAADHSVWASTAAALARAGHRVVAPDLPGHGATTVEAQRTNDLGPALTAFADAVSAGGRYHVIAHSLGAAAAIGLAEARPERVARLTLIAPAGLGPDIDSRFILGIASAGTPGEVAHLLRRISMRGANLSGEALADFAHRMRLGRLTRLADDTVGAGGQRFDALPALRRLAKAMPVHVVVGLHDRIIPWQQATALPPAVAVHFMSDSGHMPQWDQTRDFVDLVRTMENGDG